MKAYKAFNADLTCRDFQYEIGKTYTINEKPEPCVAGFHACPNLNDVFNYYHPAQKVRICEVELNGDIVKHDDKVVTNSITILKEIDYQSMFTIYSSNEYVKLMAAWYMDREDLTPFLHSSNDYLRAIIAHRGLDQHLDKLIHDQHYAVRVAVAKQKRPQDLTILIKDKDFAVRAAVAKIGRDEDLDILVHDDHVDVRKEVARMGRSS